MANWSSACVQLSGERIKEASKYISGYIDENGWLVATALAPDDTSLSRAR